MNVRATSLWSQAATPVRALSRLVMVLGLGALLAACATKPSNLPGGQDAYTAIPAAPTDVVLRDYRLQPADVVSVVVYREPELSISQVEVDSQGRVPMPLLGPVAAVGSTTDELAELIRQRLLQYLNEPRVTVYVASAVSQRVVVDGSVMQPGIYEFRGRTTLLGALALARGPTNVAQLNEVAIFRRQGGKLLAAKFDIRAIRRGEMPDPEILGNDTVVVGYSGLRGAWRDFLQALPAFAIFRPF
ncbi:polysaccharide biosynthesis/export family protein [Sphingomonas sp. G-3-2-10]|uniref:polysaccharide biosynthesis/export family protein n=1 Tax=Sphingomonas sp. G-3-2-10 TaxID=2728838 RepID=UPI00146C7E23|nr:polysaccharide biosynthesis/export family protein [Sphingomonas sp. G-3-2-10]NML04466.1 polysaccharide export protein [Sphingomonas sp. G-3-2-10]